MLPEQKSPLLTTLSTHLAKRTLTGCFANLYVQLPTEPLPADLPLVLCLNHSAWLDIELSLFLVEQVLGRQYYMMALEKTVRDQPLMRRYGCFGVDAANPFKVGQAVQYAANLIKERPERCLVIFPQGNFLRCHRRPLQFQSGAAQIIRRVGKTAVLPVAVYYDMYLQKKPELFVRIGSPQTFSPETMPTTRVLTAQLQQAVTQELDCLQEAVYSYDIDQFPLVFAGRKSMSMRLWQHIKGVSPTTAAFS